MLFEKLITPEQILTQRLKTLETEKAQIAAQRAEAQAAIHQCDESEAKVNVAMKQMRAALKKLKRF